MRSTRLLTCMVGLSALVTLNACQDHRLSAVPPGSPASRLRVKSLSEDYPNNQAKRTLFSYDGQGRLSSALAFLSPDSTTAQVERNTYQYNAQNRLSLHQRQVITRPGAILGPFSEQEQLSYNAAGQLVEVRYSYSFGQAPGQTKVDLAVLNNPGTLQSVISTRYNSANQLIGSTKSNYFQGRVSNETVSEYTYSGDNVTFANLSTAFYNPLNVPVNRQQISLAYDTRVNPFYGVNVVPDYFGVVTPFFPNLTTFSRNNITVTGGLTYRYEYNAADLPTVRYTINDRVAQTLRFEYESY